MYSALDRVLYASGVVEAPANSTSTPPLAIVCRGVDRTGVLYEMTSVIVRHGGYIHSVDILERGDYAPEFPLEWMQKDLHLAALSAQETAVALPLTNAAKETYQLAARDGHAHEDFSAIYAFLKTFHL